MTYPSPPVFKRPKQPTKPSRPKQTQPYRPKSQTQSYLSSRKEYAKRSENPKQFPPLSKPHPPQNSGPTLSTASPTTSRHSSGRKVGPFCGTMGRIDRQQVGPLYRPKSVQDPIQLSSSPIGRSDKSESIFLPVIMRRNLRTSQETGSGKGTESGNSRLLFPAIPSAKKEWKVMPSNRSFFTKSVYKQTAFQDGDSQVSMTINNGQQLGCPHRSDGCIFSCTDTSDIQKIPSVHL